MGKKIFYIAAIVFSFISDFSYSFDFYRSISDGYWNDVSIWLISNDGVTWREAQYPPSGSSYEITTFHNVIVSDGASAAHLYIKANLILEGNLTLVGFGQTLFMDAGTSISGIGAIQTTSSARLDISNCSAQLRILSGITQVTYHQNPTTFNGPIIINQPGTLSVTGQITFQANGNVTNRGLIYGTVGNTFKFSGYEFINDGSITVSNFEMDSESKLSGTGTFTSPSISIEDFGNVSLSDNFIVSPLTSFTIKAGGKLNPNGFVFTQNTGTFIMDNGSTVINSGVFQTESKSSMLLNIHEGAHFEAELKVSGGTTFAYDSNFPYVAKFNKITIENGATLRQGITTRIGYIWTYGDVTNNGILGHGQPSIFKMLGNNFINNGTILTSIEFTSNITLSGTGTWSTISPMGIATIATGSKVKLLYTHQMSKIIINPGGTFDISSASLKLPVDDPILNNGIFKCTGSTVEYNGLVSSQTISTKDIIYDNLTINNSLNVKLSSISDAIVNGTLSLIAGDLNLNSKILTISSSGMLSETPGNIVFGNSGYLTTTRNINAPSSLNIAGFGVTLTTFANLGETEIRRGHSVQSLGVGSSIKRYYEIIPSNNLNLNATLVFKYDDSELNLITENTLGLFRSTNSGSNWIFRGGILNTTNNSITLERVDAFSRWTAGVKQFPIITNPKLNDKWISGETDTIKWTGNVSVTALNIKCILNFDTPIQSEYNIAINVPTPPSKKFGWKLPESLLSFQSKIVIENASDPTQVSESEVFRIKPYLLTRVNPNLTYYEFTKDRDQWGFENDSNHMWPEPWWRNFDYKGLDPFLGHTYSQDQGNEIFKYSRSEIHVDWISFVNTFTYNSCYITSFFGGIYSPIAMERWKSVRSEWNGSCFGIATANALVFRTKNEFFNRYPTFPSFVKPINVISDRNVNDTVKKVINELFTHQFGQPHVSYIEDKWINKTPTETLNDIKAMLLSENDPVRILLLYNNGPGGGGHAVNVYKVSQDPIDLGIYYIYIYDNSNPNSINPITIDTTSNGGKGQWSTPDWLGWGGDKWIFLGDPAVTYLVNPTINGPTGEQSHFILRDDQLQVFSPQNPSIIVKDVIGNITGFTNNNLHVEIPNSFPLIIDNGSKTPPYGYDLPADRYSVIINNFPTDKSQVYFFTGNKSFSYERIGATPSQTDKLHYDDGVTIINTDEQVKIIKLRNIIDETTQAKVFQLNSIDLIQNDSLKVENLNIDNLKIISHGSSKEYDLELNFAAQTGLEKFHEYNINLPANTSHTIVTDWSNITNNDLIILEDLGNNGSIDDTLRLAATKILYLKALIEGFYNNVTKKMVRDTVRIYYRNVLSPFDIIDSVKSVLDSNGEGSFNSRKVLNGIPYYIVLKHRNSIETWSKNPISFVNSLFTYNFTSLNTQAYGNNLIQVDNSPVRYATYSGDVNQDEVIDASDMSEVDNDAYNSVSGYVRTDLTGDDFVDAQDQSIVDNNAYNSISVIRP